MLKAIAKRLIRENHWRHLSWHNANFGFVSTIAAYLYLLRNDGMGRAPNMISGGYVYLRPGTTDEDVYNEIFMDHEYDLQLGDPRFIIDAGAHIGLSTVYFASRYPGATVVAIEPEPSNFQVLLRNTARHPNVKPIEAGLWSKKTQLKIENSGAATWAFRVLESPTGEGIAAVGVADILTENGTTRVDILKIDIEGSEIEVLGNSYSWIDNVGALIIELHDRFRSGCSAALDDALAGHDYTKSTSGESVVTTDLTRRC